MASGDRHPMKLVFCGTPAFAVPTLEAVLAAGHEVALVLTQPDRPAGRGMQTHAGAVSAAALSHKLPLFQPEKIKRNEDLRSRLEAIAPDAILVVAYGRIIPDWMLALPRHGCINLHGSLLPKYRGAAPIQWALANGERETGVTTMRLDSGLDTGPMLLAQVVPVAPEETAAALFLSLAAIGAELVVQTLTGLENGSVTPIEQNHAAATLAPILTRDEGRLDPARTARQTYDRWRAFYPWPGAFTTWRGKKFIVHALSVAEGHAPPGELRIEDQTLFLGCADNTLLRLEEVQVEGKARMAAADFIRGYQVLTGERIGA